MTDQPNILLVDDDKIFTPFISEYLASKGMKVTMRHGGEDGLAAFTAAKFDLCILDVKMPFKDGFTLAHEIRQRNADVPFIFLSSQSDKDYRIRGLSLGADDYVAKPFSMEELYLRMLAILRRTRQQEKTRQQAPAAISVGKYKFNSQTRELEMNGRIQKMTNIESRLLELFCEHPQGVIERDQALRRIWSDEDMLHGRSLNVFVSKLRQYLRDDANLEILNVHGRGYQLVVRVEAG